MPENQQFTIVAKLTGYTLRKDANGVEKVVLQGLASNTRMDLTGERMADTAIDAMAKSLEANPVMLNNEHRDGWDDDFGEVTKLWVNDDHELMMEAEADPDHYRTQTLMKALDKGKQLGLSIGGYVIEAAMEWFADVGRKVMTYKNISLYHVAITGTPAVADTWVSPITKSVKDWKDDAMTAHKTDEQMTEDETTSVVEPTETPTEPPLETAETVVEPTEAPPASPTTPVPPPAAGEQDEEQHPIEDAAAKSAAIQADEALRAVAKAAVLGSWAESEMTGAAIESLSWNIRWTVAEAVTDTDRSPEERIAHINAALDEYHKLVLTVATALITNGVDETTKAAITGDNPADVSKSLTEKDTKVVELEKSVTEKDAALTKATTELATFKTELETIKARKGKAFDKFPTDGAQKKTETAEVVEAQQEATKGWATFVTR